HSREHREARPVDAAEIEQRVRGAVRAQGKHPVAPWMRGHHAEGARPDRAGRSENRKVHLIIGHRSAARGSVAVALSTRSRMPPCPGSSVPLSFAPAWRFTADSKRSPTMLAIPSS